MGQKVYRLWQPREFEKAGTYDLVELRPAPGHHPLFIVKHVLETLVFGIVHQEFIHLSGPTGTAKSSLLEALYLEPENFQAVCRARGYKVLPFKLYAIEMATFEAPGELYQRRALKDGTTFDEESRLVEALRDAAAHRGQAYCLIWLRELGRVHSASVQGGLLNLMYKGELLLPDGSRLDGRGVAFVADSNYQADDHHTLVPLDPALQRRFSLQITLDSLSVQQECLVLEHLAQKHNLNGDRDLIAKVVKLGFAIRNQRSEGNLQSLPPPTIYGYLAFLRLLKGLPDLSLQQVAQATLLGNATPEDAKVAAGVFNQVFGLQRETPEDPTMGGNLF